MYFHSQIVNILGVFILAVNFLNKEKKNLASLEMSQIQEVFCGFRTLANIHSQLPTHLSAAECSDRYMQRICGKYHLQCNITELSSFKEVKKRAVKILPSLICLKHEDILITDGRLSLLLLLPPFSLYQMLFCLLRDHRF